MTSLHMTLPNFIQRHLQEMAYLPAVPFGQFIQSAMTEKISALNAETYFRRRVDRANPAIMQEVLDQVPDRILAEVRPNAFIAPWRQKLTFG